MRALFLCLSTVNRLQSSVTMMDNYLYCSKNRNAYMYLICLRIELMFENSTKMRLIKFHFANWFRLKFMILTFFSFEKKFNHLEFCSGWTYTSVVGVPSSRINNCPESLWLDQIVNHVRLNGHPLLLECLKQLTHTCRGIHPASNMSLWQVPSVFLWV